MNELISAAIWVIVWVALIGLTLIALSINRPSKRDDDEQARDVAQPHPRVRGNTAYGEKL
jgi:hypothetical protein